MDLAPFFLLSTALVLVASAFSFRLALLLGSLVGGIFLGLWLPALLVPDAGWGMLWIWLFSVPLMVILCYLLMAKAILHGDKDCPPPGPGGQEKAKQESSAPGEGAEERPERPLDREQPLDRKRPLGGKQPAGREHPAGGKRPPAALRLLRLALSVVALALACCLYIYVEGHKLSEDLIQSGHGAIAARFFPYGILPRQEAQNAYLDSLPPEQRERAVISLFQGRKRFWLRNDVGVGRWPLVEYMRGTGDAELLRAVVRFLEQDEEEGKQWLWELLSNGYPDGDSYRAAVMLEAGASPDIRNERGLPALVEAARHGYSGLLARLLAAGADPLQADAYGRSAFVWAAANGDEGILRSLLAALADPVAGLQSKDRDGRSLVHIAAMAGSPECLSLLLEGGVRPDGADSFGATPLLYNAFGLDIRTLRLLIDQGLPVSAPDLYGDSPLCLLIADEHPLGDRRLYKRPSQAHDYSEFNEEQWRRQTLRTLRHAGADPLARDADGRSLLHYAVMDRYYRTFREMADLLLEKGASLDDPCKGGSVRSWLEGYTPKDWMERDKIEYLLSRDGG